MSTRLTVPQSAPAAGTPLRWQLRASPRAVYHRAGRLLPWCWATAALAGALGLAVGLLVAPPDFNQGDIYRILFVHVPAAWMSLAIYATMTLAAAAALALHLNLASMAATALAPTGALMTCIALWTGALWGKPTWGAWWIWDARLTCELLLLFLFVGCIALRGTLADKRQGDRAAAWLTLLGAAGLPLLYASVHWWKVAHQGGEADQARTPEMASLVVAGMLLMAIASLAWCLGGVLHRLRSVMIERGDELDAALGLPDRAA